MTRMADCHPDRYAEAHGLCHACYQRDRRARARRDGQVPRPKYLISRAPWFCHCPDGPVRPDGLGECSRCHRITRERAASGLYTAWTPERRPDDRRTDPTREMAT